MLPRSWDKSRDNRNMATIEKRVGRDGITYRAKVRRKGSVPLTATFGTKQEALVWAHQTEAQVLLKPLTKQTHTVGEAIDRYLSVVVPQKAPTNRRAHIIHLTRWKERIGHRRLSDMPASFF